MSNGSGSRVMHKKTRTIKFSAKIMSKFVVPCIDSDRRKQQIPPPSGAGRAKPTSSE
jgi:hypothetical protein